MARFNTQATPSIVQTADVDPSQSTQPNLNGTTFVSGEQLLHPSFFLVSVSFAIMTSLIGF
jgi:hypothetical protein